LARLISSSRLYTADEAQTEHEICNRWNSVAVMFELRRSSFELSYSGFVSGILLAATPGDFFTQEIALDSLVVTVRLR
jgi:hypothetical protein